MPGYTYAWSNTTSDEDALALPAGTYALTATDGHGCTLVSNTFTVSEPAVLAAATDSIQQPLCYSGTDGGLWLTTAGGTAPYTYAWSNGDTTEQLSAVPAGSYAVTITDSHACTATYTDTIAEPTALVLAAVVTDVNCEDGNDGAIDLTVSGGTAGYSYLWSSGDTTEDRTSLTEGQYIPLVTDQHGCTDTLQLLVSFLHHRPVVDLGGQITECGPVTLDAGNPGAMYLWNDSSTNATLAVSTDGTYYVEVVDSNGCRTSDTVVATIYTLPTASLTVAPDTLCNNAAPVTLSGMPAGGVFSGAGVNGSSFEPATAGAGNYTLTYIYTDGHGCVDTAWADVVVETCTGLPDEPLAWSLQVAPNPNTGAFTIRAESGHAVDVVLVNQLGQQVAHFSLNAANQYMQSLSNLAQGVYVVAGSYGRQHLAQKVVVLH